VSAEAAAQALNQTRQVLKPTTLLPSLMSDSLDAKSKDGEQEEGSQSKEGEGHVMSVIEHLESSGWHYSLVFRCSDWSVNCLIFGKDILRILKAPPAISISALSTGRAHSCFI